MDNNRLKLLNTQNIERRVGDAIKTMRALKQSQFIGGDSIRFYKKDSGLVYDWGGVPPQSPQASYVSTKVLRVTATALTQNVLFADIIAELRLNSSTGTRHTVLQYIDEIYYNLDYWSINAYPDAQIAGQEHVQSWTVGISGGDPDGVARPTNTVYMKAYVVANDDVQITVTELN